jgi:hypothetical protein
MPAQILHGDSAGSFGGRPSAIIDDCSATAGWIAYFINASSHSDVAWALLCSGSSASGAKTPSATTSSSFSSMRINLEDDEFEYREDI